FDPGLVVQAGAVHEATVLSVAPTMLHVLVDHLESTGERMPSLRSISYGASPITPSILRRADAVFAADFNQGYGMTELAGNAVFLDPDDHRRGLGDEPQLLASAGRPTEFAEIRILDDDGHDVASGSTGEIAVRGEQVMKGYWRSQETNRESFVGDWFRTGDIGRLDADGYLFVIDRKKDVIITGGENVSSREVEDAIATHPDVGEVAVIGVPDPRWGESVCAVVVPRNGADLAETDVIAYGRTAIGGFKKPTRAIFIDELPRNPSGKVLKRELRELAARQLGR
ncbi:MAG: AMP-binding protein, partial [Acidimicrobiales bacterium]